MGPGGKDRSRCPASQGRHAMDETLQSISAAIFVLLSYGKFQTYANVLKPFLDTSVPGTVMPSGTSPCLRETLTSWSPRLSGGHGIQPTSSICESVVGLAMGGHTGSRGHSSGPEKTGPCPQSEPSSDSRRSRPSSHWRCLTDIWDWSFRLWFQNRGGGLYSPPVSLPLKP